MTVFQSISDLQCNLNVIVIDSNGGILFEGTIGDLSHSKFQNDKIVSPTYFDCVKNAYIVSIY